MLKSPKNINGNNKFNECYLIQAILTSAPLLLLNVATMVSVLRSEDDDDVIDITLLSKHLAEGNS
jgi:hypothetical protein